MADIKNIYFIGIGGVGMSGIALVAREQGLNVAGSDIRASYMTKLLEDSDIKVNIGQVASNLEKLGKKPDVVVVSTAILDNNEEYRAAKKLKIKIWHRAQMLAYLGRDLDTLAVAGTHGKTSTSSMLACVLHKLELDPTFLIGGVVSDFGTNAKCGIGQHYVVEADESDKSFKYIKPASAIVTNIEADHLDHYKDLNEIYEKFADFIGSVDKHGYVVVCGDDEELTKLARKKHKNVITYGFGDGCDAVVSDYKSAGIGCTFNLALDGTNYEVALRNIPGRHYASNAAAVLALVGALGFDVKAAVSALKDFGGIKRRFEKIGEVAGITVCDDYGHHPTEIASTVAAATSLGFKNVHVVWQPHRYSRAKLICDIYKDTFARAFDGCATVAFTNVYAAGETPVPGVTGETFLEVVKNGQDDPKNDKQNDKQKDTSSQKCMPALNYVEKLVDVPAYIASVAQPGDLVVTMGAGDITSCAPAILKILSA